MFLYLVSQESSDWPFFGGNSVNEISIQHKTPTKSSTQRNYTTSHTRKWQNITSSRAARLERPLSTLSENHPPSPSPYPFSLHLPPPINVIETHINLQSWATCARDCRLDLLFTRRTMRGGQCNQTIQTDCWQCTASMRALPVPDSMNPHTRWADWCTSTRCTTNKISHTMRVAAPPLEEEGVGACTALSSTAIINRLPCNDQE